MAEVKFYPAKVRVIQMRFTADDLELLKDLVWHKFKEKADGGSSEAEKLGHLFTKLGRAYNRVSADRVT